MEAKSQVKLFKSVNNLIDLAAEYKYDLDKLKHELIENIDKHRKKLEKKKRTKKKKKICRPALFISDSSDND